MSCVGSTRKGVFFTVLHLIHRKDNLSILLLLCVLCAKHFPPQSHPAYSPQREGQSTSGETKAIVSPSQSFGSVQIRIKFLYLRPEEQDTLPVHFLQAVSGKEEALNFGVTCFESTAREAKKREKNKL